MSTQGRWLHLNEMGYMVFRSRGRAGGANHLHGKSAHQKPVDYRLVSGGAAAAQVAASGPNAVNSILHNLIDDWAKLFSSEEMGDAPISQSNEFAQHIANPACGEPPGGGGDHIKIGRDKERRLTGYRFFISMPSHGRHIGAETIATGGGRDRNEWNTPLRRAIAGDIVDSTPANGQHHLNIWFQTS